MDFIAAYNTTAAKVNSIAVSKGWWDGEQIQSPERCCADTKG